MGQAGDGSFVGDYMLMLLETDRSHLGHIVTSQTGSTQTRTILPYEGDCVTCFKR